ncbi:MAG: LuxR C-terminal-related transcriptional regulator [Nitrospira sp.]|nr:LuxR C-terminal-related transcriptional regulator [Nitrospira sp.]
MIFRGPEALEYPTKKEFQHLGEIMYQVRSVQRREQLSSLASAVAPLVPHEFSACGSYNISKHSLHVAYTSFNKELNGLYVSQGFAADPSIQLLKRTQIGTVSSEDSPELEVPREITSLKLDFGVKTCLSVGVRGVLGACSYFALSNFDQRQTWKLRSIMQILGPHFHLAYMRAVTWQEGIPIVSKQTDLTAREQEIMRWVSEGKTNWEISVILHVSLNTIKFHLKNIYQKLGGVENRWAAVAQWQGNSPNSAFSDPTQEDN